MGNIRRRFPFSTRLPFLSFARISLLLYLIKFALKHDSAFSSRFFGSGAEVAMAIAIAPSAAAAAAAGAIELRCAKDG